MASPDDERYVGSAFIALPRGQRDRLYELAEAGGGKMPKGYEPKKRFPAEWIRPRLLGRVLHPRGEDTIRHARLVETIRQGHTRLTDDGSKLEI